jgi:hypothetical protein
MNETDRILNDIRSYLRISAAASSKSIAAEVIDTLEKALVYGKMDGKTSQEKIGSSAGIPQTTVSRWVDDFVRAGLAVPPNEYYSSHRALFTLEELGIDLSAKKIHRKGGQESPPGRDVSVSTQGGEHE